MQGLLSERPLGVKYAHMIESDQFTLGDANALVPWLEGMFRSLAIAQQRLIAVQDRFSELASNPSGTDEKTHLAESAESLAREIEEGVEEILDQGIIVRDVATGLVDFPSQRQGREVHLCWIKGETCIEFWHETNQGFSHREPL